MGLLAGMAAGAIGKAADTQLDTIKMNELEQLKARQFETQARIQNKYAESLVDKKFENSMILAGMKGRKTGLSDDAFNKAFQDISEQVNNMDSAEFKSLYAEALRDDPTLTQGSFKDSLIETGVNRRIELFNKQAGIVNVSGDTGTTKATTDYFNTKEQEIIGELKGSTDKQKDIQEYYDRHKGSPEAMRLIEKVAKDAGLTLEEDLGSGQKPFITVGGKPLVDVLQTPGSGRAVADRNFRFQGTGEF